MTNPGTTDREVVVCRLEEVADPGACEFSCMIRGRPRDGFVVHKGGRVYGYLNVCPHAAQPLNWKPNAFLTKAGDRIMCSVHGSVFAIETGMCIEGACPGRSLTPLRASIREGWIVVFP